MLISRHKTDLMCRENWILLLLNKNLNSKNKFLNFLDKIFIFSSSFGSRISSFFSKSLSLTTFFPFDNFLCRTSAKLFCCCSQRQRHNPIKARLWGRKSLWLVFVGDLKVRKTWAAQVYWSWRSYKCLCSY